MTSKINPTLPKEDKPTTSSVRENFAHARREIEELQTIMATKEYVDNEITTLVTISSKPPLVEHGRLWWNNADGNLYIGFKGNWVIAISPVREAIR